MSNRTKELLEKYLRGASHMAGELAQNIGDVNTPIGRLVIKQIKESVEYVEYLASRGEEQ